MNRKKPARKSKTINRNIILNQWVDDVAQGLAKESFRLMQGVKKPKDNPLLTQELGTKFVEHYIQALVYHVLTDMPGKDKATKTEQYEYVQSNFMTLKYQLQGSICEGFERAIEAFSNMHIEYYCQINPVPEPINKEPC